MGRRILKMTAENQGKILIIDDDETILMQVEQILEQDNYTAVCTNCAQDGLGKASTEKPDAIILDRRMPKMDGNETLIQLKANESTQNIPVIMLTGDNQVSDVSTSFELGAVDYIIKPFDKNNLLMRLKKVLNQADE